MFFANPVFPKYSLTITVRGGDKWMKANVGDTLRIKKTGEDEVLRTATVFAKAYLPFNLLPESWIVCNHDPDSRTQANLFRDMQATYEGFTLQSYVTVLFFVMDS